MAEAWLIVWPIVAGVEFVALLVFVAILLPSIL